MKVLILSDLFPPAFGPRMGYLCKYIKQNGWEPTVITEYIPDKTFSFLLEDDIPVIYVDFFKNKRKSTWIKVLLQDMFFRHKDKKVYNEALKLVAHQSFDLVLCSTFRTFPLLAAQKIAHKIKRPLIVDLRDIIEQFAGTEFIAKPLPNLLGVEKWIASVFRKINLRQRNQVLKKADHLITISPWHVETLKPYNPNISLIYNGYDPDIFYPKPVESDIFYITYTGRLTSLAMRNPDLLFRAVKQLMDEKLIDPETFCIRWFMDEPSQKTINLEAKKYNIEGFMKFFEYVPATEIPGILNESSILLILTNKADSSGPKGIMTTKFFEALAIEKPILCVRGDEGCLEEVINDTKTGLSAHNEKEVYDFVKKYYLEWKATKRIVLDADKERITKFSRKEQANQFIRIFEQVLHINE